MRYTRDAPISDMASGYIQAKASRNQQRQPGKMEFPFKNIKTMIEATVDDMKGVSRR